MAESRPRGSQWVVTSDELTPRLMTFLMHPERLGSRARSARALERGQVFVNEREATPADRAMRLTKGDRITVWIDRPGSARRRARPAAPNSRVPIVFEDDQLIVVNKPPGLLTVPLPRRDNAPSVARYLREYLRGRKARPLVVHRIDRDTSGLVVFAMRVEAQRSLRDQFRRHEPERVYTAIVRGVPSPRAGSWRDYLTWDQARRQQTSGRGPSGGHEAMCHYKVVESYGDAAQVEVHLVTGLRNQIRVQASLRGHPLLGERQYLGTQMSASHQACPRQALHARRLSFRHPVTGETVTIEAPLPQDIVELIGALRRCSARPPRRPVGADATSCRATDRPGPVKRPTS